MQADTASTYQDAVTPGATPRSRGVIPITDRACLEQLYMVLRDQGLATPDELTQLADRGQQSGDGERQLDPLEILVEIRVSEPDARLAEVERMSRAIAQMLGLPLVLAPFASRLPTPSAFYESHGGILSECQRMMTPVLYAEESEVIGLGSINPVSLRLAAEVVSSSLSEITGTKPIVSQLLLPHEGWISLCNKQLGI
jgi:hypothetical protein